MLIHCTYAILILCTVKNIQDRQKDMFVRHTNLDECQEQNSFPMNGHNNGDRGSNRVCTVFRNQAVGLRRYISNTISAVPPRVVSLHPSLKNIQNNNETNQHGVEQIQSIRTNLDRILQTYEGRLQTFRNWPVPFLAPEVLSEAMFCYTGDRDIVLCVECQGELSDWQIGEDPTTEHLLCFGFVCH